VVWFSGQGPSLTSEARHRPRKGFRPMGTRRTHSPEFKANVVMEANSDRMRIQEIAKDGAERLIQASQWMGQLLDGASEFPRRKRSPTPLRQRCNGLRGRWMWLRPMGFPKSIHEASCLRTPGYRGPRRRQAGQPSSP